MKKLFFALAAMAIVAVSCQKEFTYIYNYNESDFQHSNPTLSQLDIALSDLNNTLDYIYSETRSNKRKIYSKEHIKPFIIPSTTRTGSPVELPDTLAYIIPFENNEGYAVLGVYDDFSAIYSIAENGTFDMEKFEAAVKYEVENNILSTQEYKQRILDNLQNKEPIYQSDDSFVYSLIAGSIIDDIIDQPLPLDTTTIYTPSPVIQTDSIKYVYFQDYYPEMMSTMWHQEHPFNLLCKNQNNEVCPAGCVVIALAQIMAYNEYPEQEQFHNYVISWDFVKQYRNLTTYPNDSLMSLLLSNLCFELGKSHNCNVKYSPKGSSANTWRARRTLDNYNYKDVDRRYGFSSNDIDAAINMIKNNKPVYIDSFTSGEGHAWVLDGYIVRQPVIKVEHLCADGSSYNTYTNLEKQRLFHCNFGWGGKHNGYYKVQDSFNTEHRYPDGDSFEISYAPVGDKHYLYNRYFNIIVYNL